jgi:hypothetical protein
MPDPLRRPSAGQYAYHCPRRHGGVYIPTYLLVSQGSTQEAYTTWSSWSLAHRKPVGQSSTLCVDRVLPVEGAVRYSYLALVGLRRY